MSIYISKPVQFNPNFVCKSMKPVHGTLKLSLYDLKYISQQLTTAKEAEGNYGLYVK